MLKKRSPFFAVFVITGMLLTTQVFAASDLPGESHNDREVERSAPIPWSGSPVKKIAPAPADAVVFSEAAIQTASIGPNLISNPSLETAGAGGLPAGWFKGGYGTNNRVLTYPATGFSGRGIKTDISSYTDGDAKWYFADVGVTAGGEYQFSDYSLSNAESRITIRFKMSNGSFIYKDYGVVPPSSSFIQNTIQFTVPNGATSLTVFHALKKAGSLTTDDYSLSSVSAPPPPAPDPGNLISNPSLEVIGSNGLPADWIKGRWGTNTTVFSYPVTGANGGKAAKVNITSYSSGDAKWRANPVSVSPGKTYTYSDQYQSDKTTIITLQYQNQDGSLSYQDIAKVSPSSAWSTFSVDFTVPSTARAVSVMHLLNAVGSLTIDNTSLKLKSSTGGGIFTTGGVSLRFDDGWLSQYQSALPILNQAGIKGSFYIITQALSDYGKPAYMSKTQIKEAFNSGQEIGAHTRNHVHLSSLPLSGQTDEINGARQDLLAMNVGPINSFAYPFGEYTADTIQIVHNSGYSSAAATIDGNATPNSDKFQLERRGVNIDISSAQVKSWIDNAVANKQWLILAFHRVDHGGEFYSTTPEILQEIVNYIKQKQVPVVTVSEGAANIK